MWYAENVMGHVRVGDKVRFKFGGRVVTGSVIEDRGPIASQGGQLIRVKLETTNPDDAHEVEVATRDLESLEHARARRGAPRLATTH